MNIVFATSLHYHFFWKFFATDSAPLMVRCQI